MKKRSAPNQKARGGKKGAGNATLPLGNGLVKRPRVEIIPKHQLDSRMANSLRFLGEPCILCGRDSRMAVVILNFDTRQVGWMTTGQDCCLVTGACLSCLGLDKASPVVASRDADLKARIMERLALFAPMGEERPQ